MGEPPPTADEERVVSHRKLCKKAVGLVKAILGNIVNTRETDPFSDCSRGRELQEVLEEISAIWRDCERDCELLLSESVVQIAGGLGILSDFVYRIERGRHFCFAWSVQD